ncbi:hypothetical protein HDE_09954 [Halotydeus destructor]|nr:hypothetical protein HDE_09954 [Halotydeus destructor]
MSKYNTRGSTESAKNVDGKGEAHSDSGTDSGRENEKLNESTKAKSLKKLNGRAQPLSGDNRCNSRASGSLYSNSHRNDESENSDFDEVSVRRNVQKKKSSHRHVAIQAGAQTIPRLTCVEVDARGNPWQRI